MNPLISIANIKKHRPCQPSWDKVIELYGGEPPDDLMVSLGDVAQHLGAEDAYWCIRVLDWSDITVRRAVISGALLPTVKRVSAPITDERVHDCINAIERWCAGDDGVDLLAAARVAAEAAVWTVGAAAWTAVKAVEAAVWAATDTAGVTARAVEAAARAAAKTAWTAAEVAGGDAAERERQRQDIIAAFPPILKLPVNDEKQR